MDESVGAFGDSKRGRGVLGLWEELLYRPCWHPEQDREPSAREADRVASLCSAGGPRASVVSSGYRDTRVPCGWPSQGFTATGIGRSAGHESRPREVRGLSGRTPWPLGGGLGGKRGTLQGSRPTLGTACDIPPVEVGEPLHDGLRLGAWGLGRQPAERAALP